MNRRITVAASLAAAFVLSPKALAQCTTGGPGGSYPAPGALDGIWDTTLPTGQLSTPLAVTVPPGATVINSVVIHGLTHTWGGDTHIVLEAPSGTLYNLAVLSDATSPTGGGCADQLGGDYTIIDANLGGGGGPCGGGGGALSFACSNTGSYVPGTYAQAFSTWTSGNAGLNNTPLESIPIASGNWTLHFYDWYPLSDAGSIASWDICFGAPTPPPPPPPGSSWTCVTGGGGGSYPAAGALDGTWPTTLPTGELIAPLSVTVPPGSTKIKGVKLHGLFHTWSGDSQIVLQDPAGNKHNLYQDQNGVFGGGCSDPFSGEYVFVDVAATSDECGNPPLVFSCGSGMLPGTYPQVFGAWPSGSSGIDNTPLESIPISNGTWNLIFYDWYVVVDNGSLVSWDLCFDGVSGPTTYCPPQAPGSSSGCLPTIAATGNPDVAHSNTCVITVSTVEGQKSGLLFYGVSGPNNAPWCFGGNSFLCVKAPTQRTNTQSSGGTPAACDGTLVLDWNAYQLSHPGALGNPWSAGSQANVQGWFRDPPSCKTTFLSEALTLTYLP